ncbi:hypothetical protein [Methanoculleus chikugoensis]|uniref:hypothetical protein n=1 Tax=Methanoculleus chikugoensis TaxID=118126 RepID=UPI000AF4C710|nr:hypothetical protein [Methanoculleus chikugoensis]
MRTKLVIDARNILDHEKWSDQGFAVRVLGDGSSVQQTVPGEIAAPAGLYPASVARPIAPPSPPSISLLSPNGREGFL